MLTFFPSKIGLFTRINQLRRYTKENLYEYVNGHAEYFISAGFEMLAVGDYRLSGDEDEETDAVVDIYDMGKSIQAFSILADESRGKTDKISTGAEGFRTQQGISFVKGQYYVRISSFNEKVSLDTFAEQIDALIGTGPDASPEFARLPHLGEVLQTRYVREAYRGLDFVNNVIEREYRIGGENIQVFLFTGQKNEVRKLVRSFMKFFSQSEIQYDTIVKMGITIYEVNDPYEGDWLLIPLSDAIIGIYGHIDDITLNRFLDDFNS
jgi:hypothetical protein